jgi:hypothetical protein
MRQTQKHLGAAVLASARPRGAGQDAFLMVGVDEGESLSSSGPIVMGRD